MGNKLVYPEVDLSGKVAVVTGGNTGIGYETAKALVRMGAHTFIACRSKERAEAAIDRMKAELAGSEESKGEQSAETQEKTGEGESSSRDDDGTAATTEEKKGEDAKTEGETEEVSAVKEEEEASGSKEETAGEGVTKEGAESKELKVEFLPLDLSSFQSTSAFVTAFKEKNLPLHILINNAAVAWIPFSLTDDGYETQLQVNHLSPLLLTLELLPVLLETAASSGDVRIVFVSSRSHNQAAPFDPETFLVTKPEDYSRFYTYPTTKQYNIMAAYSLQRHLDKCGITVSSLDPGYVKTELFRGLGDMTFLTFLNNISLSVFARTAAKGAATTINCAVNPALNTQESHYYASCTVATPSTAAGNKQYQEMTWANSMKVLKEHLSPAILEKYGEADLPSDATVAEGDPSSPAAEGDPSSPTAEGDPSSPAAEGDPSSPAAEGDPSSPAAEGNPSFPPAEGDPSSPPAEGASPAAGDDGP